MDYPRKKFDSQKAFEEWLGSNSGSDGIWLKLAKKGSGETTVTYAQAVESALCYGWIDSQTKTFDDKFYIQKFTPRRAKSIWSLKNREKIEELMAAGRLQPAGLAQVQAAKADGRWAAAYDSPSATQVPDYFLAALNKNHAAKDYFETISKANKYSIAWRLNQSKRPETKERLTKKFIDMLAEGKTLH
jgi:uncharacterized protein YdeI (YjbR/CyaY-like superfamily)